MPTPRIAKSLGVLRDQVNKRWPKRNKSSDGWIGDARHSATVSDHNPDHEGIVRALDITHDPKNGVDAGAIAEAIIASKDPRVKYIIYNRRMVRNYAKPGTVRWQWSKYTGSNPHTAHMHVSINGDHASDADVRPWALEKKV